MGGRRIHAVLFDAAGTLLRVAEPVGETYARLARPYGVSLPASRVEEAFRRVLRAAPPLVFPEAPPAEIPARERAWWREVVRGTFRAADGTARFTDFEGCFDALFAHYAHARAWEVAPGAPGALATLRAAGLRTGVVSNFDGRLPGLLEDLGLASGLELVVLPAQARAAKPDRRIFDFALAALDLPAHAAVYVGDDAEHDVAGARAAGLHAIHVGALATLDALPDAIAALEEETPQ
jgi:putative hydrolase of the HAD superfamily